MSVPAIGSLDELYTRLQQIFYDGVRRGMCHGDQRWKDEINAINAFLRKSLTKPTPEFIADLNRREKDALTQGKISLCCICLRLTGYDVRGNPHVGAPVLPIGLIDTLLNTLTSETLSSEGPSVVKTANLGLISITTTPLNMAVCRFVETVVSVDAAPWMQAIISKFLEEHHVSPDHGRTYSGDPLIFFCLSERFRAGDANQLGAAVQIDLLFRQCVRNSLNLNQQTLGQKMTALHLAARNEDEDYLRILLTKKPDLELKASIAPIQFLKKTPLAMALEVAAARKEHAEYRRAQYEKVRMLLEAGADPNAMPENPMPGLRWTLEEKMLTPFQLAVDEGLSEFVELFLTKSAEKGMSLVTALDPAEKKKRESFTVKCPGEMTLETRLKAVIIARPHHLLSTLKDRLQLSCYVQRDCDRDITQRALEFLFENAKKTAIGPWWGVIRDGFFARMPPKLFVYSDSLDREDDTESSVCIGSVNTDSKDEIYLRVLEDESLDTFIINIAHECGHYFGMVKNNFSRHAVPPGFENAYQADVAAMALGTIKPHPLLKALLDFVPEHYPELHWMSEYFTRACVEFPMRLYLLTPDRWTQASLRAALQESMPNMLAYFETQFSPIFSRPQKVTAPSYRSVCQIC